MPGAEFFVCFVGPIRGGGPILLHPGGSYRLDLQASALRAPAKEGYNQHAVLTQAEIRELKRRGFEVSTTDGPFDSEQRAGDALDSAWQEPD